MVDGGSSDWLPPGFTEKVKYKNGKKIKYYHNVATGAKYNSKKEVIRATADSRLIGAPQPKNGDDNSNGLGSYEKAVIPFGANEPDWLPEGWVMEEKTRQSGSAMGSVYKVYIEWTSGKKFYSKVAVKNYLETLDHDSSTAVQNEDIIGDSMNNNGLAGTHPTRSNGDDGLPSDKKVTDLVVKANDSPQWLPKGWTMEERARLNGSSYKVYIEWSSGKKFYSKPAVTNYLKTSYRDNSTTVQNEGIISDSMDNNGFAGTPPTRSNGDNGLPADKKVTGTDLVVTANDSPQAQWLPKGWTMEERAKQNGSTYKVYIESSSGRKFYSRIAVTKYLNTAGHTNTTPEPKEDDIIGSGKAENNQLGSPQTAGINDDTFTPEKNVDSVPDKIDDTSQWLPEGWIVEERPRPYGSSNYKVYIHLSSGNKFYSRLAVTRYLSTLNHSSNMDVEKNVDNADKSFPEISPQSIFKTSLVGNESYSLDKNVDGVSDKMNHSSHWLPEGWTVEERSRHSGSGKGSSYKVYTHLSSGNKFYSRAAVTRYLNTLNHSNDTDVQDNVDNADKSFPDISPQCLPNTSLVCYGYADSSDKNVDHVPDKMDDSLHWLPEGWTVEERTRNNMGSRYKVYTHLSSGNKFYSRPAVTRYLSTLNHSNTTEVQNNVDNADESVPNIYPSTPKKSSQHKSESKKTSDVKTVTTETTTAEDLPPGWMKEIRISTSGSKTRRDLFFIDPVSGYVFRSKPDALRYVQTNDIHSCLSKPLKREPEDNVIPSSNQDSENSPTMQLFLEGKSSGAGIFGSKCRVGSKAKNSKQAQGSGLGKQAQRNSANLKGLKKRKEFDSPSKPSKRLAETVSTLEVDPSSYLNIEEPEDQTDAKSGEKLFNDGNKSPESQGGYNFGDSWNDPVEFALKTFCGDIPIDDNLLFPGRLNESLNIPPNQEYGSPKPSDGCLKPSKTDEPIIFKNEFARQSEPSPGKRHGALALLQSNPTLFSAPNDGSFPASSSFNGQSGPEDGKKYH